MMELDDLKCPICLEILSDPVMLPLCGHSLCRACLISLTPQPPLCPICRTQHQGLSVDQLPTNYIVANLIRQQNTTDDSINMSTSQNSTSSSGNISNISAPARPPSAPPEATETPSAPPLSDILDIEEELVLSAVSLSQESHLLNLTPETLLTEQLQMSTENTDVSTIQVSAIITEEETSQSQSQREHSEINDTSPADVANSSVNPTTTETFEVGNRNLYSSLSDMNTLQSTVSLDELCSNSRHLFSVLRDAPLPEAPQRSSTPILQFTQVPSVQIKTPEPSIFECKQIISGLLLSLVALVFLTAYSWMIISSIFGTGFNMKFENIYILLGGVCGLPKFIHLACRLIRGMSSKVEKFVYVLYFLFDITMLFIGIIFVIDLKWEKVILVNSPFAFVAAITMIISALSVTNFPATPNLKSKSCCGKFLGCALLFLFTLSLFVGYSAMIVIGHYYFKSIEQIYLLIAGSIGLVITLYGICFLINGKQSCCAQSCCAQSCCGDVLGCLYFVYSIVMCIVGLILVERIAFWIVNGPMIAITGIIVLFWCIRVTALSLNSRIPRNQSSSC